jgi:hypothetical protein
VRAERERLPEVEQLMGDAIETNLLRLRPFRSIMFGRHFNGLANPCAHAMGPPETGPRHSKAILKDAFGLRRGA